MTSPVAPASASPAPAATEKPYPLSAAAKQAIEEMIGGPFVAVPHRSFEHPVWDHIYTVLRARHDGKLNRLVAVAGAKIVRYLCAHCGVDFVPQPTNAKRHVHQHCKAISLQARSEYAKECEARASAAQRSGQSQPSLSSLSFPPATSNSTASGNATSAIAELSRFLAAPHHAWDRSTSVNSRTVDEAAMLFWTRHYIPF